MTTGPKKSWLAVHLYYNEPWEEFLTKALEPYINSVIRSGVAEQYFFIRYWDRGPHIRLRFKGDTTVFEQIFRPNLLEHFENYFEDKPSKRTDPHYPENFPEELKWLPNNSVHFFNYEPEVERYGGITGVQIAEEHFHASSDAVLSKIKEKGLNWTYDDAMGTAIRLHLSFIFTMGLDLNSAVSFFRMIFYNWLPRSFRVYSKGLSREDYHKLSHETIESFSKAYELQKPGLISFHQNLWEGLLENIELEDDILNSWIQRNLSLRDKLNFANSNNQLVKIPSTYKLSAYHDQNLNPEQKLHWNLLADYIHMTNNRLGILNRDEGYLGFLMMKSLRALQADPSNATGEIDLNVKNIERMILDELF